MDPVFGVMLDVARLATFQPPAVRQLWLECEPGLLQRMVAPEPMRHVKSETSADRLGIRWLPSLSLKPR
jgi:hypothetical protein